MLRQLMCERFEIFCFNKKKTQIHLLPLAESLYAQRSGNLMQVSRPT